jgi:ABC-2 type transport system ATP-binding protein
LDEAERLCDRVGVFKTRLLVIDTPAALRRSVFGQKVIVHLRAANEALAAGIKKLPFVSDVRLIENKLVVQLEDPAANNPQMIRELVNAGADVQFVGELRYSLEEVYLQLVKNA